MAEAYPHLGLYTTVEQALGPDSQSASRFSPRLSLAAGDKVVAARALVGDEGVEAALGVEDDAVGAGRAAGVDAEGAEDGESLPRAGVGEVEALVVVVPVGVVVCRDQSAQFDPFSSWSARSRGNRTRRLVAGRHTAAESLAVLVQLVAAGQGSADGALVVADVAAVVDAQGGVVAGDELAGLEVAGAHDLDIAGLSGDDGGRDGGDRGKSRKEGEDLGWVLASLAGFR